MQCRLGTPVRTCYSRQKDYQDSLGPISFDKWYTECAVRISGIVLGQSANWGPTWLRSSPLMPSANGLLCLVIRILISYDTGFPKPLTSIQLKFPSSKAMIRNYINKCIFSLSLMTFKLLLFAFQTLTILSPLFVSCAYCSQMAYVLCTFF